MAEQDFDMILTKQDYFKLQKWEGMYKKLEKSYTDALKDSQNVVKQVEKLKEIVLINKKTLFSKNQEINFLKEVIKTHIKKINGTTQEIDLSQSYYQQLVDFKSEGFSSILVKELIETFQFSYHEQIAKLGEIERKLKNMQIKINENEMQKVQKIEEVIEPNIKKNNLDQEIIKDLIKQKNVLEGKIKRLQKQLKDEEKEKAELMKQIENLQNKPKKQNSGEKSYQIKHLVDDYYRELQVNLATIGGLDRNEIQMVVTNEFKGIIQYVNTIMKKVSAKNK